MTQLFKISAVAKMHVKDPETPEFQILVLIREEGRDGAMGNVDDDLREKLTTQLDIFCLSGLEFLFI